MGYVFNFFFLRNAKGVAEMEKERIRMSDIAQELNVIHGKTKKISDETVRRVQELIERRIMVVRFCLHRTIPESSVLSSMTMKSTRGMCWRTVIAASVNTLSRRLTWQGIS